MFDSFYNALTADGQAALKPHMPALMKQAADAAHTQPAQERRAPPPPPAAKIDAAKVREDLGHALAFADSEESAEAAYTLIVGPIEKELADEDLTGLVQMLRGRVSELEG